MLLVLLLAKPKFIKKLRDNMSVEIIEVIKNGSEVIEVVERGPQGPQGPQGIQGEAGTTSWDGIADKPLTFTPSAHTHVIADVTDLQTTLDSKINSDVTGITGADAITNIISLSQAEYDAISVKSNSTLYVIV